MTKGLEQFLSGAGKGVVVQLQSTKGRSPTEAANSRDLAFSKGMPKFVHHDRLQPFHERQTPSS